MKQLQKTREILDLFEPEEGTIDLVYGRIGNGKTYCATEMILDDLRRGQVVYANWHLNYDGFDERQSPWYMLSGILLPWRRTFYEFPRQNLKYLDTDKIDVEYLSNLTDCNVYIDEGQWIFDSYEGTKFSKAKRKLILHTRHLNRRLVIITQRPTAIQVSARGNVNRYFKCQKWLSWPFKVFRQFEYQDMVGETVDETKPVGRPRVFIGKKRIFAAYNSKYLRGGIPRSQELFVVPYDLTFFDRVRLFLKALTLKGKGFRAELRGKPMGLNDTNGVKESSGVPTTDERKVEVTSDRSIRNIQLRTADQEVLPF